MSAPPQQRGDSILICALLYCENGLFSGGGVPIDVEVALKLDILEVLVVRVQVHEGALDAVVVGAGDLDTDIHIVTLDDSVGYFR